MIGARNAGAVNQTILDHGAPGNIADVLVYPVRDAEYATAQSPAWTGGCGIGWQRITT